MHRVAKTTRALSFRGSERLYREASKYRAPYAVQKRFQLVPCKPARGMHRQLSMVEIMAGRMVQVGKGGTG